MNTPAHYMGIPYLHNDIFLKPNSITLAGSKLIGDQLRTS